MPVEETIIKIMPRNYPITLNRKQNHYNKDDDTPPISRYLIHFYKFSSTETINPDKSKTKKQNMAEGSWLHFFLLITKNTRNVLFCYGLGYIVSLFLLTVEFLNGGSPSFVRILLRPIAGGIAAGLLYILVISGGVLIWKDTNDIRELSVGVIAVYGSLFCEQLPHILKKLLRGNLFNV